MLLSHTEHMHLITFQFQIDKFFDELFLYYSTENNAFFEKILTINGLIEVLSKDIIYLE